MRNRFNGIKCQASQNRAFLPRHMSSLIPGNEGVSRSGWKTFVDAEGQFLQGHEWCDVQRDSRCCQAACSWVYGSALLGGDVVLGSWVRSVVLGPFEFGCMQGFAGRIW